MTKAKLRIFSFSQRRPNIDGYAAYDATNSRLPIEIVLFEALKQENYKFICAETKYVLSEKSGTKDQEDCCEPTSEPSVKCIQAKKPHSFPLRHL